MLVRYRPRTWHLVIVALIAAFDLVVLYMVLNPRVADDYRAYYIDRSASCFPRITSGYYPLGAPVSFAPGRNGYLRDTIRWCGFMAPTNVGIKSFGDYGILKLKFQVPDSDLLLTFSSWVNSSADKPPRDVQVVVNGERLQTLTYTTALRLNGRIVVPAWLAKKGDGGLEIKFEVPRIGPPGTNSEPVTLQLRLEALRVSVLAENKEAGSLPPPKTR